MKVCKAVRLNRLLIGLALGYILLLALGASRLAQHLRREMEILRKKTRHGTPRTLSVLSLAVLVVADLLLLNLANLRNILKECLLAMRRGQAIKAEL